MQSSNQEQHLGDKIVDGNIILQWVLRVHLRNIMRVITSRMKRDRYVTSSIAAREMHTEFWCGNRRKKTTWKTYAHMGG